MKYFYLLPLILFLSSCGEKKDVIVDELIEEIETIKYSNLKVDDSSFSIELNSETNANSLLQQIWDGRKTFDFYASFTEPFWTIYFIDSTVLFSSANDSPQFYSFDKYFDNSKNIQTILLVNNEKEWTILIEKGEGSDGMSEIVYPYKIILNDTYHGGGGEEHVSPSE